LISPDYSRDFIIFSFTSWDTIAGVLLQKDVDDYEHPVAFMSKVLRDPELNYSITEKQAYALVKSLKHFRNYVGYNKIKAYVPYPTVKDVLTQQDCMGTRGKWVSKIQEYDLEMKPTKIITKEIMSQGPQVLDMGYREPNRLEHGPGAPIFSFFSASTLSAAAASVTSAWSCSRNGSCSMR
jgi:hypothetical protein